MSDNEDLTWDVAIKRVLQAEGGAMRPALIAEKIKEYGYRSDMGANPAMTVTSTMNNNQYRDAYQRVGWGIYTLKSNLAEDTAQSPDTATEEEISGHSETGGLKALGMFWERSAVNWTPTRIKLLGRQSAGDIPVDFADQIGIYLLHDRDRVIYVGRATDAMSDRLRAHTLDRLRSRWDRFSWFGLYDVAEDGAIVEQTVDWSQSVVIETLEATLIESLEPPLNRRRGDNFAAVEYLQAADPDIEKKKNAELLSTIARMMAQD